MPTGELLLDTSGNLFGTTEVGGKTGSGAIFQLQPGAHYTETLLKSLCTGDCGTGGYPLAGLIEDVAGNLYGTAFFGGEFRSGVVFELLLSGGQHRLKVLHSFANSDGAHPAYGSLTYQGKESGLPYDGTSMLFGATEYGGDAGAGAIFALTPPPPGKTKWAYQALYSFCTSDCSDGKSPEYALTIDSAGNLYGGNDSGVLFELSPAGTAWTFTRLYTSVSGEQYGPLLLDNSGNLVGTATVGGPTGAGTLFRLQPNGMNSIYTQLYAFSSTCGSPPFCPDGGYPRQIAIDAAGNVFGTTFYGGANQSYYAPYNGGTLFEYSNSGSFHTLYSFCSASSCADGSNPQGGPILEGNGALFGMTFSGGVNNNGVVYRFRQ